MKPALPRVCSLEEDKPSVPFSTAMETAKKVYTQEMAKVAGSSGKKGDHISEEKLKENHDRISSLTVQQLKTKLPLTSTEEILLVTELNDLLVKIREKTLDNDEKSPAVGIDLGTTYSCVGVYQDGKVTIIPNELGQKTTPSYIAYDDLGTLQIGDPAKNYININPSDRIYNVKRLIGRSFDDPIVQKDMAMLPFQIINQGNTPMIKIKGRSLFPEQVSAKVLVSLKEQAEKYLNCPVINAVVTVPAYFSDGQREATKDATKIAGLNVLRILNEPTAAAIAYSHKLTSGHDDEVGKNILIFDFGGGTLDVCILFLDKKSIRILAVGGDTHLGGEDLDNRMVEECMKEFKKKSKIDLADLKKSKDPQTWEKASRALRRLKNACEEGKRNLGAALSTPIVLEALYDRTDFLFWFRRELFNSLNTDIFQKCIDIMGSVLKDAGMAKEDIQDVVLVGGSTRVPKIRDMVQAYFDGKDLCRSIHPDEAVANGAALAAALCMSSSASDDDDDGDNASKRNNGTKISKQDHNNWNPKISDVIPLHLGIKIYVEPSQQQEGERENNFVEDFNTVIPKNTTVPCSNTKSYATPYDNCRELEISVFEGVEKSTTQNHLLGRFLLQNLPQNCPQGQVIDVCMEVNAEGILHVSATCPDAPESQNDITVNEFKERLKYEDVLSLIMEELFLSIG